MKTDQEKSGLKSMQLLLLTVLRIGIGWHFLYEGLVKLTDPFWTSAGYLSTSTGFLSGFFQSLAANEAILQIVDILNIWGLIIIGACLFLGLFTRIAQFAGILLLSLYYLSNPPSLAHTGLGFEGSYLFVSKDLLEIVALIVLSLFPTGMFIGLDGLFRKIYRKPVHRLDAVNDNEAARMDAPDVTALRRREVLKHLATLPLMGGLFYGFLRKRKMSGFEEQYLVDAMSGASIKPFDFKMPDQLTGVIPKGQIKDRTFSKLILGGNLLNGWAHSRDLIYVSSLVRAYHTKSRIFNTLWMAEECGVDTVLSHPAIAPVINEYWDRGIGKIQFISDCAGLLYDENGASAMPFEEYKDLVKFAIDQGATACYVQGESTDYYIGEGMVDRVVTIMDIIRDAGLPVGIGAHHIESIKRCVDLGLETDFWMKTLHDHDYWSARHPTWHDNMYCFDPEETITYMETLEQPWIAFKVLSAGAILPHRAFPYAFQNGADFICSGMYDFQLVDDVNLACEAIGNCSERKRPWRA